MLWFLVAVVCGILDFWLGEMCGGVDFLLVVCDGVVCWFGDVFGFMVDSFAWSCCSGLRVDWLYLIVAVVFGVVCVLWVF